MGAKVYLPWSKVPYLASKREGNKGTKILALAAFEDGEIVLSISFYLPLFARNMLVK